MVYYSAVIDLSTALVANFDDMSVLHKPETDQLHVLSSPVVTLLRMVQGSRILEAEVLELIKENCFDVHPVSEEDCQQYLQLLVSQGIFEKTQ
ncbi:hypothetical protein [Neptunomonas antarctica]|uniref:PqqD family protein, HPr-rel-A system n=1 Tax=Neptunomonas antarctica TaxID=619304 RepID=A0A1N7JF40_9GAMM|nr:hypothetical protein [Neptunomonas antarctica]SIS47965.1 hypothetical protein SAMN05421760_1011061 [Neptunomonas antarctica]